MTTKWKEAEKKLRARQNSEPWGKLLLSMNMDPYDTESSARHVAMEAAERIEQAEKLFQKACERLRDVCKQDDGQAFKEAEKFLRQHNMSDPKTGA